MTVSKKKGSAYSGLVSIITSVLTALAFYLVAFGLNVYSPVDMLGGAVFVFVLSLIVSFSIIPQLITNRLRKSA
ncbi:MAG: hypothetical protein ACE5IO_00885 [Thermoplasmata archaeon]